MSAPTAVEVGAIRLHYTRQGQGPPVLLLHDGASTAQRDFAPLVEALAPRHDVVAPDLRGHGRSTRIGGALRAAWPAMVRDLTGLLDALAIEQARVLGVGDGATLALHLALDSPARVQKLLLAGARACVTDEDVTRLDALRPENVLQGAPDLARLLAQDHGADYWELLLDRWVASFRIDRAYLDARPRLGQLKCDVLLMHGVRDPLTPHAHAQTLADAIPGARLLIVDTGRAVHREADFESIARDFLA